jgi:hypothetical protein
LDGGSAPLKAATYTRQHKNKSNAHTNIHASIGTRTHDCKASAGEDISCLRLRGHYDRHITSFLANSFRPMRNLKVSLRQSRLPFSSSSLKHRSCLSILWTGPSVSYSIDHDPGWKVHGFVPPYKYLGQ